MLVSCVGFKKTVTGTTAVAPHACRTGGMSMPAVGGTGIVPGTSCESQRRRWINAAARPAALCARESRMPGQ
jgi:hypothetical protein